MICNLHSHTTYCDGENSVEEMILAAIDLGIDRLGFSGHCYMWYDDSYCMSKEGTAAYIKEVRELAEKYADRIEVICGVEQDFYAGAADDEFDNVIGSVHYLKVGDKYLPVDESVEDVKSIVECYFDDDYYAWIEEYFETVAKVVEQTNCNIIGHFDLVTKFNEDGSLFDEADERFLGPAREAIDVLVEKGVPFEINTGAVGSGYRSQPYPCDALREYIEQKGGKFVYSSDAHCAERLLFGYEEWGC